MEIPTATRTFLGSSYTVELLWILSDVGATGKSKMAAINRKYICNVVYLSRSFTGTHVYVAQAESSWVVDTVYIPYIQRRRHV